MSIRLKVEFDGRKARQKMAYIKKKVPETVAKEVYTLGQFARKIAVEFVPIDTGLTESGILSVVTVRQKDKIEVQVGFQKNPHPEKGLYQGRQFNLPEWMTYSKAALDHPWHAGSPRFLIIAKEMTNELFSKQIGFAIRRVIQKRGN